MLTAAHELTVELGKRLASCGRRLLGGRGIVPPYGLAIEIDSGLPLAVMGTKANAKEATLVVLLATAIATVLRVRSFAKILKAIVGAHAIDVVDLDFRPFARNDQPDKAISKVKTIVDPNLNVAIHGIDKSGCLPRPSGIPFLWARWIVAPSKDSKVSVVLKAFANFFSGQIIPRLNWHVDYLLWPTEGTHSMASIQYKPYRRMNHEHG
jgi:hypothetical protein